MIVAKHNPTKPPEAPTPVAACQVLPATIISRRTPETLAVPVCLEVASQMHMTYRLSGQCLDDRAGFCVRLSRAAEATLYTTNTALCV